MSIYDAQFQITPLSCEHIQQEHRERMRRFEAYQLELAALEAAQADSLAHNRFVRMFRIRQALYRWAPRLAARMML